MNFSELNINTKERELIETTYCRACLHGIMIIGINANANKAGHYTLNDNVTDVIRMRVQRAIEENNEKYILKNEFDTSQYQRFFEVKDFQFPSTKVVWKEIFGDDVNRILKIHEEYINSPVTQSENK